MMSAGDSMMGAVKPTQNLTKFDPSTQDKLEARRKALMSLMGTV